jgi:hypothetical protein
MALSRRLSTFCRTSQEGGQVLKPPSSSLQAISGVGSGVAVRLLPLRVLLKCNYFEMPNKVMFGSQSITDRL